MKMLLKSGEVHLFCTIYFIGNCDLIQSEADRVAHSTANNKSIAAADIYELWAPPIVLYSPLGERWLACACTYTQDMPNFLNVWLVCTNEPIMRVRRNAHCALFATYISRSIVSARAARALHRRHQPPAFCKHADNWYCLLASSPSALAAH